MDRMLYVAMSGAKQALVAQTANSHNLANVNTPGFRGDLNQFRAMPVFGPGFASRVYAMQERPGVDYSPGAVQSTGRPLDVAVRGDGWIAVQAGDGGEAYTRAGDLHIASSGFLLTGAGHPVLGNGGPIAIPPGENLEVGLDGTISLRLLGQPANALAEVDRIKLVNPSVNQLVKDSEGLFRLRNGATAPADAAVSVTAGSLESSNVNAVEAMVNMITLARQFELQVKLMRTAEQDDEAAAQMMRLA